MNTLLILSPFLVAPLAAWIAWRLPRVVWTLALWPAWLALLFADALRTAGDGPRLIEWPWAPGLGLVLSFNLDGLGLLFATLITAIGSLILLYASAYLSRHRDLWKFEAFIFVFMGAMLGVVLSDNLFALFVFWELTGFSSFLLIGFDHDQPEVRAAALQALIVTGVGGAALLGAAVLLEQITGETSLSAILASGIDLRGHGLYPAVAGLVMLAAFTKSAQVPFHFWLPTAMAAPTPVSAYLHSATMVKAGVYLIARTTPTLGGTTFWTTTVTVVGAATLAVGAWRAVQESDLKRILAYSTVSALGALVLLLGIGSRDAAAAALVYLVAHACYKGALFMVAGAVDHAAGTRDVTVLSGLRTAMPMTAAVAALAAASMLGLPLLLGFFGKELLYDTLLHGNHPFPWTLVAMATAVGASVLLGAAALTTGVAPFAGAVPSDRTAVHEAPFALWFAPAVLAAAGLLLALAPATLARPLGLAAAHISGEPGPVGLQLWHGLTLVLGLSVLTIALAIALYAALHVPHGVALSVSRQGARQRRRDLLRRVSWPRSLGAERLYTGVIGALDRLSAATSPAMQAASLRSYVLVVVLTVGTLVGLALVLGGGGWTIARVTPVRPHDAIVILVICLAALTAARSSDSMTAVICLGTVGYGVALTFMFFGAPDLAMTQFSVETLTVVIFVLVFRHFGNFGSTSPALIRWRDAIVSGAFGLIFATLTLLVGSSGSASRVSEFFVEAAPRLAHGRNIVNVILVDFRALDTLGEITVLVTAAIGVNALLRISAERKGRT